MTSLHTETCDAHFLRIYTMVQLKVKWGGKLYDVDVDVNQPVDVFKAQLQSLTGVPVDRQKISGMVPAEAQRRQASFMVCVHVHTHICTYPS